MGQNPRLRTEVKKKLEDIIQNYSVYLMERSNMAQPLIPLYGTRQDIAENCH